MSKTSFRVALIGSSGGGSAAVSSGEQIIESIQRNVRNIIPSVSNSALKSADDDVKTPRLVAPIVTISDVAFVQCPSGLDFINSIQLNELTELWVMACGGSLAKKIVGSLEIVNHALLIEDQRIANLILSDEIDAVITISSHPEGSNKQTITAAITKNIPIIGTGGTSLSHISTMGGNVIGCSGGSVATTGESRISSCSLHTYFFFFSCSFLFIFSSSKILFDYAPSVILST